MEGNRSESNWNIFATKLILFLCEYEFLYHKNKGLLLSKERKNTKIEKHGLTTELVYNKFYSN